MSTWALGNFIVEDVTQRDTVLAEGVLNKLTKLFDMLPSDQDVRKEIIFFIHNCFVVVNEKEKKNFPKLELVAPGLRVLS